MFCWSLHLTALLCSILFDRSMSASLGCILWWNFSTGLFVISLPRWWRNCFLDIACLTIRLCVFQVVILWLHFSLLCMPMFHYMPWFSLWWMIDWLPFQCACRLLPVIVASLYLLLVGSLFCNFRNISFPFEFMSPSLKSTSRTTFIILPTCHYSLSILMCSTVITFSTFLYSW